MTGAVGLQMSSASAIEESAAEEAMVCRSTVLLSRPYVVRLITPI